MSGPFEEVFGTGAHQTDTSRQRLVFSLLGLSCMISLLLLIYIPNPERITLENSDIIDSMLYEKVSIYGVGSADMRIREQRVDSIFTRKHITINVPPGFPATTVHARLAEELHPANVEIIGERFFPENRLELRFIYAGRLVRTAEFVITRTN